MTYQNLSNRYILSVLFAVIIAGLSSTSHAKPTIPDDATDFVAPEMYTHNEMLDEFGTMEVPETKALMMHDKQKPEAKDPKKGAFNKMIEDEKKTLKLPPLLQDQ